MKTKATILIILVLIINYLPIFSQTISLLHTNDLHAHILEQVTASGDTSGGFAQISMLINKEMKNAEHPVFVADAGDFLMGTFFQMIEMETAFQLDLMNDMGYDVISLGNHEFDFGVDAFANYARKANRSGCPPLLLSNIDYTSSKNEQKFSDLFRDSIVQPYTIIEKEGVKVGFIGVFGQTAYDYTPNLHEYKLLNKIKTTKKYVKILQEKHHVDFIICLSHSGVYKNDKGDWDISEDIELAKKVKGIDAIISGHTHTYLEEPIIINGTPIVQTASYGKYIGKLTLEKNNPSATKYKLIPVSGGRPQNGIIPEKIELQFQKLKDTLNKYIGIDYNQYILETQFSLNYLDENPEMSNIGPLIADAIHYNVNQKDEKGTDISLIAQGMIRSGLEKGSYTLPQIFQVASLGEGNDNIPGYALSRMYFKAREIKLVLEMLEMMAKNDPTYYCHISGAEIIKDENAGFLKKIKSIKINNEESGLSNIDLSKRNKQLYAVTADTYMMRNLSMVKKKSLGLIKVIPKMNDGKPVENINQTIVDGDKNKKGIQEIKVWQSILDYAASFEDHNNNDIPDVPEKYKQK